ncbi:MAG: hypothetical protein LPK85_08840, partial [Gammaproteobacteria bacterium]|nr:hypothetical protein [Gammaproteobacteria bacterium]
GLLRAMEGEPRPLSALAEEWHQEALERARAADVPLSWATRLDHPSRWLSPRQQTNLTRILREALSNALRHARPERIRVELRQRGDQLELLVDNDVNAPVSTTPGRGTLIMQARVAELGGELSLSQGERWQLVCRVPLAVS